MISGHRRVLGVRRQATPGVCGGGLRVARLVRGGVNMPTHSAGAGLAPAAAWARALCACTWCLWGWGQRVLSQRGTLHGKRVPIRGGAACNHARTCARYHGSTRGLHAAPQAWYDKVFTGCIVAPGGT